MSSMRLVPIRMESRSSFCLSEGCGWSPQYSKGHLPLPFSAPIPAAASTRSKAQLSGHKQREFPPVSCCGPCPDVIERRVAMPTHDSLGHLVHSGHVLYQRTGFVDDALLLGLVLVERGSGNLSCASCQSSNAAQAIGCVSSSPFGSSISPGSSGSSNPLVRAAAGSHTPASSRRPAPVESMPRKFSSEGNCRSSRTLLRGTSSSIALAADRIVS